MAKYSNSSNYAITSQNLKYLDIYQPKLTNASLSENATLVRIGNRYHRRPDLLAFDMYGNPRFWWVFVHYNRDKLRDPINDFVAGLEIKVPAKSSSFGAS
jgi:hypothetical protein